MKNSIAFVILPALLVFFAGPASAHLSGQSLEQKVGRYIIDIGYDSFDKNPAAGRPVLFDFSLFTEQEDPADFHDVRVTVISDSQTVGLADILKSGFGRTAFIFTFPESGLYKLRADYRNKNNESLAQYAFDIQADPPEKESAHSWRPFAAGVIAGAASAIALPLIKSRRRGK